MTDINPWWRLIHKATKADVQGGEPLEDGFGQKAEWFPEGGGYNMVPLNEYQMGNLLGLFYGAGNFEGYHPELNVKSGDWWYEVLGIIGQAMADLKIEKVHSNNGMTFSLKRAGERWGVMAQKGTEEAKDWF